MPSDDPLYPDERPVAGPARLLAAADDPRTISADRILAERPDVLAAYHAAFDARDKGSTAWADRVGGETPQAYAKYWYDHHGKYEGYNQGSRTAQDNVSPERILAERPDVLRAYYEEFHGANNDPKSDAWMKRVGGESPEAYARYWYEAHGKWEGYSQSEKAAEAAIDVQRLLVERPDVLRGFFDAYYGGANDRKSGAWAERVGDATPEAYAKYWYVNHGRAEGYNQTPPPPAPPPPDPNQPDVTDPFLDPWNHPAIFPNWPNPGWETGAPAGSHLPPGGGEAADGGDAASGADAAFVIVGAGDADPFGVI